MVDIWPVELRVYANAGERAGEQACVMFQSICYWTQSMDLSQQNSKQSNSFGHFSFAARERARAFANYLSIFGGQTLSLSTWPVFCIFAILYTQTHGAHTRLTIHYYSIYWKEAWRVDHSCWLVQNIRFIRRRNFGIYRKISSQKLELVSIDIKIAF